MDSQVDFQSGAELKRKFLSLAKSGTLTLARGSLTFADADGETLADIPVGGITKVESPWSKSGTALRIEAPPGHYTFLFMGAGEGAMTGGIGSGLDAGDIAEAAERHENIRTAQDLCDWWKSVLADAMRSS
jgi:hypothetical protein